MLFFSFLYHLNCCSGHFEGYLTACKVILAGYWWSILFKPKPIAFPDCVTLVNE